MFSWLLFQLHVLSTCQVFALLWEFCVPWFWRLSLHDSAFATARASRVSQWCQVSWLGNTILEVVEVWITYCTYLRFWFLRNPNTFQRPGRQKRFWSGGGLTWIPLFISGPKFCLTCLDCSLRRTLHSQSVLLDEQRKTGLFQWGHWPYCC